MLSQIRRQAQDGQRRNLENDLYFHSGIILYKRKMWCPVLRGATHMRRGEWVFYRYDHPHFGLMWHEMHEDENHSWITLSTRERLRDEETRTRTYPERNYV